MARSQQITAAYVQFYGWYKQVIGYVRTTTKTTKQINLITI